MQHRKTCCMVLNPMCKAKIVTHDFKKFNIDGNELSFESSFKYLGHILCNTMSDDADIKREVRNLYMRANVLARLYSRCSRRVKFMLFKLFCMCFYDICQWRQHFLSALRSFKSAYHGCLKLFFNYNRYDSVIPTHYILSVYL